MRSPRDPVTASIPVLTVRTEDHRVFRFTSHFLIGRDPGCSVWLDDDRVGRRHVRVVYDDAGWRVCDQNSSSGVYVGSRRIRDAAVGPALAITLGPHGPRISLQVERAAGDAIARSDAGEPVVNNANEDDADGGPSGRTVRIQRAYKQLRRRQHRLNLAASAAVALVVALVAAYAYFNYQRLAGQRQSAEQLFAQIKELDLALTALERQPGSGDRADASGELTTYRDQRQRMSADHDQLAGRLRERPPSPEDQLVLQVTRLFGECDIAVPPGYVDDVIRSIARWRDTGRYASAIARARDRHYLRGIVEELRRQRLPPQFFYVAMQESDFIDTAVGPPTPAGYAKGMWMLPADTGQRYGLNAGPLAGYPRPDPGDDRQNWAKATRAAAAFIKELYATQAQASGLLVLALYHGGDDQVRALLDSMPATPRERNFWRLLRLQRDQRHRPMYDYVVSIVSAAVIGENPRLFGFDFDNPLAGAAAGGD